ncbi:MAG: NUDIX hydrolase [Pseudomonadota bacterium]
MSLLIDNLRDYAARFPTEQSKAHQFIDFLTRNNVASFDRELREGHITGSAWLLNPALNSVLLTHHRKLDIWVQLGGHADGNTDAIGVAMQEAQEESGITGIEILLQGSILDIDRHTIPARGNDPAHYHYDLRFALRAQTESYIISQESKDLRWVPLEKIEMLSDEDSLLRMRDKWDALAKTL